MSVKKVGGLYFFKVGRIGGSLYLGKRSHPSPHAALNLAITTICILNLIVWSI